MRYQQPNQPMHQQPSQPMQPVQPMPPMQQQMPPMYPGQQAPQQMPMQQVPPMQQPVQPPMQPYPEQPVPQQTGSQSVVPPGGEYTVPLSKGFRKAAGLYFRDTWQMLLGLIGLLLIIFVAVRLATRGYLWGLIFVLIAGLALEFQALGLLPGFVTDVLGGKMTARTIYLQAATVQSPSLLARLGLSTKVRYALQDDQGRSYYFCADKGLDAAFGDLQGMEVEVAFLEGSRLMTGIHPVRRTEQLSLYDSARERHLRQVFKDYLLQ